jgi:hypothetical protein
LDFDYSFNCHFKILFIFHCTNIPLKAKKAFSIFKSSVTYPTYKNYFKIKQMGATCCPGLCYDPTYGQYGGQWGANYGGGYGQPLVGGPGVYVGGVGVMPGVTTSVIGGPGLVRY